MTFMPPARLVAAAAAAVLALTACSGGSGDANLSAAQARVTAKEAALTSAKAEATSASGAFCSAAQTYITALDRYGDVLNATAPTVGDVNSAGKELVAPRQDAIDGADAAMKAEQQVAVAEQELAMATAALEAAKAQGQAPTPLIATTPPTTTATTPPPIVPAATTNRVKQAESDFQTAQAGIAPETPLTEAAQRFNAAAVALELSWLRLFADAGCLTAPQQQEAEAAVHDYTVALQTSLGEVGYYQGAVDGVYGPTTVEAVEALQKASALPVTGTVDKATDAALQAALQSKGGAAAQKALVTTTAVQQTLKLAGFWDGPVGGPWTPELTDALKAFQTKLGVEPTGTVDSATVSALYESIATARSALTSTTTSSPAVSATSTGAAAAPSTSAGTAAP